MSRSVVLEQHVPADPVRVYAAWTSAAGLASWWWPHLPDTTYDVDARVGGGYVIRSASAGIGVRGTYLALDEPNEIGMTFEWLGGAEEVSAAETVRVTFTPVETGTLVRVTHSLAETAGEGEGVRQGWHDVLARLAQTQKVS